MKKKTILLSAIILGGFAAPVVQQTVVNAQTVQTEVTQNKKDQEGKSSNNQEPRTNKIKLGDKISLDQLNAETSIVVPSTNKDVNTKLDDIFVNLTDEELAELKANKETTFQVNDLEITTNWKGSLSYESVSPDMQLQYDDNTQTLSLLDDSKKVNHITYELINGDANVHYVFKDTGEEIYQKVHKEAFESSEQDFTVKRLESLEKGYLLKGHFDAVSIDLDNLANVADPLRPTDISFEEEPLVKEFDRDKINKDNAEFTVKLEKAKPTTFNLNVYLDGKIFSKQSVTADIFTKIPKQTDEKLPDPATAKLNNNKTYTDMSYSYFPQMGVSTMSGKAFHQTIFDVVNNGIDEPTTEDFFNQALKYYTLDMRVRFMLAGRKQNIYIYYESDDYSEEEANSTVTSNVHINSNLGLQTVLNVTGKKGETVLVKVPQIEGYKPDKETVKAKINEDGTITTDEKVKYYLIEDDEGSGSTKPPVTTPEPNPNPTSNPNPAPNPNPDKMNGFVGTMKQYVKLYQLEKGQMKLITNKELGKHSNWKFDQTIKVNGKIYYRVATNEWVDAKTVYRYQVESGIVETKDKEFTSLVSSDAKLISNRGLGAHSSWQYDRIAYLGDNEEKYYRVATDEFIAFNDVIQK